MFLWPVFVRSLKLSLVEGSQHLDGWLPGNTGCFWLSFFSSLKRTIFSFFELQQNTSSRDFWCPTKLCLTETTHCNGTKCLSYSALSQVVLVGLWVPFLLLEEQLFFLMGLLNGTLYIMGSKFFFFHTGYFGTKYLNVPLLLLLVQLSDIFRHWFFSFWLSLNLSPKSVFILYLQGVSKIQKTIKYHQGMFLQVLPRSVGIQCLIKECSSISLKRVKAEKNSRQIGLVFLIHCCNIYGNSEGFFTLLGYTLPKQKTSWARSTI